MVWFRRDLRVHDLPTLTAAAADADTAVGVFVLDDQVARPGPRTDFFLGCLAALNESLDGRLLILHGDPEVELPRLVDEIGAGSVHISADFSPYGRRRDEAVETALGTTPLVRTGSPYAVAPGRVVKGDGTPYRVFSPYQRAWHEHGWRLPASSDATTLAWLDPTGMQGRQDVPRPAGKPLAPAGETAALDRWHDFLTDDLADYGTNRDRPDLDRTSRLSAYLKTGCLHPRTLLHDMRSRTDDGAAKFRSELCWREFYADVLHHRPDSAYIEFNEKFRRMPHDTGSDAQEAFRAWCEGRTGYPIVDAGMRQLAAEGWMHNRVRMIVASFLTKDLHLPWQWGARHFMDFLIDGDLASNQHGWQWVAGCGTDASPYFRVFNPTTQGEKFDPTGDYVRRWIPELRSVPGKKVHKPTGDRPGSYPEPIVDHAAERLDALDRYASIKE
ncbi:deoxyribodipyrimidine photo-lyase [Gordonia malaquae]|uniref:Deoxyribodipyrimidine photo-lyase n=1 Tax=Gordonia malaquae NBRC 108250 TaxID=1223542 RepID=M3TI79_GORML|nr:deoxyribodipyrimidine photo-lyase [Gordonia malaquae NBRC 108250]SEE23183.1 deoxyribodipyrimidine photo-lyase [Gordonia malaquae]